MLTCARGSMKNHFWLSSPQESKIQGFKIVFLWTRIGNQTQSLQKMMQKISQLLNWCLNSVTLLNNSNVGGTWNLSKKRQPPWQIVWQSPHTQASTCKVQSLQSICLGNNPHYQCLRMIWKTNKVPLQRARPNTPTQVQLICFKLEKFALMKLSQTQYQIMQLILCWLRTRPQIVSFRCSRCSNLRR